MSIRTRLTLWYTGLLGISLFIFSLLLYSLLSGILLSVVDDRLATQAQNVINLMQTENDPLTVMLSGKAKLPPIDVFASQYYIQIVQMDGQLVQVSENLRDTHLPLSAEVKDDIANGRIRSYTISAGQGARLRELTMPILLVGRRVGAIQVAQSLTPLDDSLNVISRALLIGSVSSLLLAAVGGVVLARAALRPIQAITRTARRITQTQDLSQRIPVAVPNDELGRLTSTINDMLARLAVLFQTQQRLVADVSHELRTPLTTIQGNLDLLRRGAADDPALRADALRAIGDEAARMQRMINDLLLLAQLDAGLQIHRQPVEMDTLLLDVYRQAQVIDRGVTLRLGAEDQALVLGDRDRLRQLLLNLVDNALKYTPAGGQVTLTLRRGEGWVQVAVTDTGVGITPEDVPHLFERFYRADRSRARQSGAGLGLSIAQWVAQAHGGRIEVESQVGRGSTFTVWLPQMTGSE